jgi:hypothetical protein
LDVDFFRRNAPPGVLWRDFLLRDPGLFLSAPGFILSKQMPGRNCEEPKQNDSQPPASRHDMPPALTVSGDLTGNKVTAVLSLEHRRLPAFPKRQGGSNFRLPNIDMASQAAQF